jgi:ATP-dependent DNA helicase RecQ
VSVKEKQAKLQAENPKYTMSERLFERLRNLRLEIAREEKVPAFVIFSDATLTDMCLKHPQTDEEMLSVSGVGQIKLERYGKRFLQILCEEEPNTEPTEELPELTQELFLKEVLLEDNLLQISRVADNINAVLIRYGKAKTSGMKLNSMMIEAGYLEAVDGVKLPTDNGRKLGIGIVERHSSRGNYTQCLFSLDAQKVCVELTMKTCF